MVRSKKDLTMKVFVMDPIARSAVARLAEHHTVVDYPASRQADWHADADALIVRTYEVRRDDFARSQRLRIVAKHGTGVDNIDLDAAAKAGVWITNTPGANANAVAEYALAMTLAVVRRVSLADRSLREGRSVALQEGIELKQKTVGLVGLGDIGGRTARLFRAAFDARIIAYDPYVNNAKFDALQVERVSSLEALLPVCDVVSLHLPLSDATRNLFCAERLAMLRPSAFLINVARGGIVDESALYDALLNKRLAGAAFDVFESEPVSNAHPLLTLDNFIGSPHIAAGSIESLQRTGAAAVEAVIQALSDKTPAHVLVPR
jgi:D-3-phosphoglycerate dehydrogenase